MSQMKIFIVEVKVNSFFPCIEYNKYAFVIVKQKYTTKILNYSITKSRNWEFQNQFKHVFLLKFYFFNAK
jgi:hypothetical protein